MSVNSHTRAPGRAPRKASRPRRPPAPPAVPKRDSARYHPLVRAEGLAGAGLPGNGGSARACGAPAHPTAGPARRTQSSQRPVCFPRSAPTCAAQYLHARHLEQACIPMQHHPTRLSVDVSIAFTNNNCCNCQAPACAPPRRAPARGRARCRGADREGSTQQVSRRADRRSAGASEGELPPFPPTPPHTHPPTHTHTHTRAQNARRPKL